MGSQLSQSNHFNAKVFQKSNKDLTPKVQPWSHPLAIHKLFLLPSGGTGDFRLSIQAQPCQPKGYSVAGISSLKPGTQAMRSNLQGSQAHLPQAPHALYLVILTIKATNKYFLRATMWLLITFSQQAHTDCFAWGHEANKQWQSQILNSGLHASKVHAIAGHKTGQHHTSHPNYFLVVHEKMLWPLKINKCFSV